MRKPPAPVTRRIALLSAAAVLLGLRTAAATAHVITVYRDPSCGCCTEWVKHLQKAGYSTVSIETADLEAVKGQRGVPSELAACHTAEIGGYVIEGHVPA